MERQHGHAQPCSMVAHAGDVQDGGKQQNNNRSVRDVNPHNAPPSKSAVRQYRFVRWCGFMG